MANWVGVVTNAGNSLLNEWVNEKELHFDSAATGTGTVDTVSMLAQTALVDQKQTASIIAAEKVSAGIRLKLRITAHTTGYTLNQYGIWATVTGGVSTMIALFQHDQGIPVPGVSESPDFVYTFYALIACSNAGTWTVNIDMSAAVTADELNEAIAEVEAAKQDNIMAKGILKGDGKGNVSAATPGQDYGLPLPTGAGKPTETTVGVAGQHYYDSSTGKEYVCTGKSADGKYLWKLAGISDASEITYDGTQKLSEKIAGMDAAMLLALAAAAPYSSEQTYAMGAYCTRGGKLYRCTTAISAVEVWTDAHWTETTMGAELVSIYTTLANNDPRKWGLGTYVQTVSDLDSITDTGWYAGTPLVDGDITLGGSIIHHFQYENSKNATQIAYTNGANSWNGNIILIREKKSNVWNPWEWNNPPMRSGIEYRTTERHNGKPVYKKLVYFGTLSQDEKLVSVSVDNIETLVRIDAYDIGLEGYSGQTGIIPMVRPSFYINFGGWKTPNNVVLASNSNWSAVTNWEAYAILSYTKTTD